LEKGYEAQAIRYLLLSVQYRKQLNFTIAGLEQAQNSLDRIKRFLFRLKTSTLPAGCNAELKDQLAAARTEFEEGLDDDLNTARALGALFVLITDGHNALDRESMREENRTEILQWIDEIDKRMAIVPKIEESAEDDSEIEALVAQRNEA